MPICLCLFHILPLGLAFPRTSVRGSGIVLGLSCPSVVLRPAQHELNECGSPTWQTVRVLGAEREAGATWHPAPEPARWVPQTGGPPKTWLGAPMLLGLTQPARKTSEPGVEQVSWVWALLADTGCLPTMEVLTWLETGVMTCE